MTPERIPVTSGGRLRIAVGVATLGRPQILAATVAEYGRQFRPPDAVFVCAPSEASVEGLVADDAALRIILGPRGSCVQRNAIIDQALAFDVMLFADDDFLPRRDYIEVLEEIFATHGDVVMTTGSLIADGILGPGLSIDAARALIADDALVPESRLAVEDVFNGYGCNMAVRIAALRDPAIRFDENLPLYGWLEDVDFSRRLSRHGRIVRTPGTRGVHLGVKAGRQPGRRLGYSQLANPLYLARKGSFPWWRAVNQISRNVAANCWRALRPEPYIDRRGRVRGNAIALMHLATARLHPRRVLEL
jgi:GT2 family glycosyltransferase